MNIAVSASALSLFLLVLARASGLVLSAPVLGDAQVPRLIKAALAIALSLVLVQIPSVEHAGAPAAMVPFALTAAAQLILGIALGFVARLIFFAMETAGGIISLEMGLSISAVLNPLTGVVDSSLTQLYTVVAGMIFLAVGGDELLVAALARSFDLAPLGSALNPTPLVGTLAVDVFQVTQIGLQIAMPIAASLIAANIVLGVVSRSMPQLNLFILSLPLNVLFGLLALIGSLSAMLLLVGNALQEVPQSMLQLLPAGR